MWKLFFEHYLTFKVGYIKEAKGHRLCSKTFWHGAEFIGHHSISIENPRP